MAMRNISLVGFMGTGKTTVGKILADRLGFTFIDVDEEIEFDQGMAVSDIFDVFKEKHFRALERDMIQKITVRSGLVISAGGGAVIEKQNMKNMRSCGPVICLSASPDVIFKRIEGSTHRPLLKTYNPLTRITDLLKTREEFYARADFIVDTDGLSPEQVADKVMEILQKMNG